MHCSVFLRDLPSRIESSRLLCRVPEAGDGVDVYEAVQASLAELRAVLAAVPWAAGEPSVEASESFCRKGFADFHDRKDFPFLLYAKDTQRLVGACGLHRPDWDVPRLEIGYWCRSGCTGQGFMTEAVQALMQYAYEKLGAVRLEIVVDESNVRSRRVAERSGFALEGILRSYRRSPAGELRDICIYARLADAD